MEERKNEIKRMLSFVELQKWRTAPQRMRIRVRGGGVSTERARWKKETFLSTILFLLLLATTIPTTNRCACTCKIHLK